MTDSSLTGLAIYNAVRASLRLVSCSTELLTIGQLVALKDHLREASAIVGAQIQSENLDDHRVIIDLSDWESASDAENEEDENKDPGVSAANTADSGRNKIELLGRITATGSKIELLEVPEPYPMNPPNMDELPEYWYVVDYGTEVGIFADSEYSNGAVAGIPGGHQTRVKSWRDAATLYNELYHKGDIIRIRVL